MQEQVDTNERHVPFGNYDIGGDAGDRDRPPEDRSFDSVPHLRESGRITVH